MEFEVILFLLFCDLELEGVRRSWKLHFVTSSYLAVEFEVIFCLLFPDLYCETYGV